MKIIVDTNIIFSGILNTDGKIGDLLMNSHEIFEFYTVTYLRQEIEKHKEKLEKISGLSSDQIEVSKLQILNQLGLDFRKVSLAFSTAKAKISRNAKPPQI
ncbi:MAG: PIN domain-containing protein [Saprospiraceae bacterium]